VSSVLRNSEPNAWDFTETVINDHCE